MIITMTPMQELARRFGFDKARFAIYEATKLGMAVELVGDDVIRLSKPYASREGKQRFAFVQATPETFVGVLAKRWSDRLDAKIADELNYP